MKKVFLLPDVLRRRAFVPALMVLAAFGAGILAEIGYRLNRYGSITIPGEKFESDPASAYIYNHENPGYAGGVRGGFPTGRNPGDAKRIACFGESVTSGDFIVDDAETWPAILERLVDERAVGPRWEVYNCAVGGYGTRHILGMMRARIKDISPDVAIIYAGTGGNGLVDGSLWAPYPLPLPSDTRIARIDKRMYRTSAIYRSRIRHMIFPFLARHAGLPNARGDFFHGIDFAGVAEDIGEIIDVAKGHGSRPVVILFPIWEEKCEIMKGPAFKDSLAAALERIKEVSASRSATVLDMRRIFRDSLYLSSRYFIDYHHFTAHGNGYFAKCLAESLFTRNILQAPAPQGLRAVPDPRRFY